MNRGNGGCNIALQPLFVFARFPPRISHFISKWINSRPACKSRLNLKFQENNYFGTKNETFYKNKR